MKVAARMSNQFSFIFIKQFHKNNISFYVLGRIVSMGGYAMMILMSNRMYKKS